MKCDDFIYVRCFSRVSMSYGVRRSFEKETEGGREKKKEYINLTVFSKYREIQYEI